MEMLQLPSQIEQILQPAAASLQLVIELSGHAPLSCASLAVRRSPTGRLACRRDRAAIQPSWHGAISRVSQPVKSKTLGPESLLVIWLIGIGKIIVG